MVYEFAGIRVNLLNDRFGLSSFLSGFETENNADLEIDLTKKDIEAEKKYSDSDNEYLLAVSALYRKIADLAPKFNTFLMHGAAFSVDGECVIFTAPSGTGKTTHMRNWFRLLKDRAEPVNGDKPLIRLESGEFFAFPTPWCGKERIRGDKKAPVKAVCFINRSKENRAEEISKKQAFHALIKSVYLPENEECLSKTLSLLDKFMSKTKFYNIFCDISAESAKPAYDKIFNNDTEGFF